MIAAPLSPALSCLKVWASSLLNRTTINTTTVQIKHIFLNFTQIVFFVFPIIEQLRVRWVMRPISTIYCCSFCFKVQFRIARVQRCTVLKLHCTLLRRHVKVQHTFTVARVQVEWRLLSLQNTAVDCILRQFGNCNYVALLLQEYMWTVEWLRVKGEKKSSSHAHLCQPTSLGSFGSSRRSGPSRAVIAVAVFWKYFFLENYP